MKLLSQWPAEPAARLGAREALLPPPCSVTLSHATHGMPASRRFGGNVITSLKVSVDTYMNLRWKRGGSERDQKMPPPKVPLCAKRTLSWRQLNSKNKEASALPHLPKSSTEIFFCEGGSPPRSCTRRSSLSLETLIAEIHLHKQTLPK